MKQDWLGNKASVKSMLGVRYTTNNTKDREQHDYYATDPIAVRKLIAALRIDRNRKIWECACGEGHLSKELLSLGYDVYSSDLIDRGYGDVLDFLETNDLPKKCDVILTNPPYKYTNEFVKHSLDLLPDGGLCYMLLNINQLAGQKRYNEIYSRLPMKYVFVFSSRVQCAKNADFSKTKGYGAINYGWFVWEKGFCGDTVIKWL